jgi:hypothetical protein
MKFAIFKPFRRDQLLDAIEQTVAPAPVAGLTASQA